MKRLNKNYKIMNQELASFIEELNFLLGLNTAHDYDGVENESDI